MILLLCGTTEGKILSDIFIKKGVKFLATVTTSYGSSLLKTNHNLEVLEEKLNEETIKELIDTRKITAIVDVTHPYAENISKLALEVSRQKNLPYFRYERPKTLGKDIDNKIDNKEIFLAEDYYAAAQIAKNFRGKIFLTIGSRHLPVFLKEIEVKRLVARVLPLSQIIKTCEDYGFTPDNLIAMKGPFSIEMNTEIFKSYGACVVVTKDSGKIGGTEEKIAAARNLKIPIILIKPPSIDYGKIYHNIEEMSKKILNLKKT